MGVRMKSRNAPKDRTIAFLQARGWVAADAEGKRGPTTVDLFGCIDVVAVHPEQRRTLFVQCTSNNGNGNFAARLAKTKAQPTTHLLLRGGITIEVWGWSDAAEPRCERLLLRGAVCSFEAPAASQEEHAP